MSANITNEVLATKLDAVGARMDKFENKIDALGTRFVAHEIFELRMRELETAIQTNELAIKKLGGQKALQAWLVGIASAVSGSVLTFLIIEYMRLK